MTAQDALPSDATAHLASVDEARPIRAFGPVIVAQRRLGPALRRGARGERRDVVALCLPIVRASRERLGETLALCDPGGGLLLSLGESGEIRNDAPTDGLVLVLSRRVVTTLPTGPFASIALPCSAALDSLAHLAEALLRVEAQLSEAQGRLAGKALTEMLAAVLLPLGLTPGLVPRREATLFDRLVDHLDGHLCDPVDVAALCSALKCSRSALYRAAAPAGGVMALINHRRLTAVRDRLGDPRERASIAALARAHGFSDAAAFSHSFKRRYGITAGQLRRGQDIDGDRR